MKKLLVILSMFMLLSTTTFAQTSTSPTRQPWYRTGSAVQTKPNGLDLGTVAAPLGDIYAGNLYVSGITLTGNVHLNDDIFATYGNTAAAPNSQMGWETADANANEIVLTMPEGGATDVPVFVVADASAQAADLGLFNGITDPTIAVLSDAHDKAMKLSHNGTDGVIDSSSGGLSVPLITTIAVAGVPLTIQNTTDAASNQLAIFQGPDRATSADDDEWYHSYFHDNDAGTQIETGRFTSIISKDAVGDEEGTLKWFVGRNGALFTNPALQIYGNEAETTPRIGVGNIAADPFAEFHVSPGSISNTQYDTSSVEIVEGAEGALQFIANHSGNLAGAIMLSAVVGANDTNTWAFVHKGPSATNAESLSFGRAETAFASSGDILGSVGQLFEFTKDGEFVVGDDNDGITARTGGVVMAPDVATGGAGNLAGADLTLAPGLGTGTGDPGAFIYKLAPQAAAGDNLQTSVEALILKSELITGHTAAADTDGQDVFLSTQDGGAHTSNDPDGGDFTIQLGDAGSGGTGTPGIFTTISDTTSLNPVWYLKNTQSNDGGMRVYSEQDASGGYFTFSGAVSAIDGSANPTNITSDHASREPGIFRYVAHPTIGASGFIFGDSAAGVNQAIAWRFSVLNDGAVVVGNKDKQATARTGGTLKAPDMIGGTATDAAGADITHRPGFGTGNGTLGKFQILGTAKVGAGTDVQTVTAAVFEADGDTITINPASTINIGTASTDGFTSGRTDTPILWNHRGTFGITTTATKGGTNKMFEINDFTHINITAATELNNVFIDVSGSKTWLAGAGPLAEQSEIYIDATPEYIGTAGTPLTITQPSSFTLEGPPTAGANMTFTNEALTMWVKAGPIRTDGWQIEKQQTLASANDMAVTNNSVNVTGTTQINRLAAPTSTSDGTALIRLHFNDSLTVKHGQASGGGYYLIRLAGSGDFSATDLDTLTLEWNATDSEWREVSRTAI